MKELLENNYVIILDTNVLLNVYKYSPVFSDFSLKCLQAVKAYIYFPSTVLLEYKRNNKREFFKMEKRVSEAGNATKDQIDKAKKSIIASCDGLEKLQFPDVDDLREALSKSLDTVQSALVQYFDNHEMLNLLQHMWAGNDRVEDLVNDIESKGRVFQPLTQEELYRWCDEGENRYKKKIPPGFMDAKEKDGIRKYSDLIIWQEVLRFAKEYEKNIIFVTDDVKADWWEDDNGTRVFHSKLIDEFGKTGQRLQPMTSQEFYKAVSEDYGIEKSDAIELALNMTDDDYCVKIADDIFDIVECQLMFDALDYIEDETAHIGSEGIDEFEVVSHEFIGADRVNRDECKVYYAFKYRVTLSGTSYEYWGKEPDTKELILSDGRDHVFEGEIIVEVKREAEIYYDFEDDNSFETATIIDGSLKETSYEDRPEPGESYGEYEKYGNCPDCGCALADDNYGGNGFCIECAQNH